MRVNMVNGKEVSSLLERLAVIEEKFATTVRMSFWLMSLLVTATVGAYGFLTVAILQVSMDTSAHSASIMNLVDVQSLHVFDDAKHQNNTSRVDDIADRVSQLSDRVALALLETERLKDHMLRVHEEP